MSDSFVGFLKYYKKYHHTLASFSIKASLVIGSFFIIFALPFVFIGYTYTFNPPTTAVFSVNGIDRFPGDPEFSSAALVFLTLGMICLIIGLIIFFFPLILIRLVESEREGESFNSNFEGTSSLNTSLTSCTACGSVLYPADEFCSNCGKKVDNID